MKGDFRERKRSSKSERESVGERNKGIREQ